MTYGINNHTGRRWQPWAPLLAFCCMLTATPAEAQTRRVVVEEYTGTWCIHCPRGMVGLQRLNEDYGDRVITIAVHTGDNEPMTIPTYPDLQPDGGVPSCTVDRMGKLDPYSGSGRRGAFHYGIDLDVDYELQRPTEAGLELKAQWNDALQWDVSFIATTTFNISSSDAPYRLAFILLEDGLQGQGKAWQQANAFSGSTTYLDDDMAFWRQAPEVVEPMTYNHVAVNTLGIRSGISGSIQAPIVAGQPQTYTNLVTTLNVKVIQDKSRLSAVALLLNTETGEIVNAAQADILPFGTDAVSTVTAGPQPAAVLHDLQGRRLHSRPAKGLYLQNKRKYIN